LASALDVENLNKCIRDSLIQLNRSALFLFDGLDEGWFPDQTSTAILGGLASASSDFADYNSEIHSILFVRDNIFRSLAVFDKDFSRNIEPYSLRLRWDEATLFSMITNRLRFAMELTAENDVKIWNRFAQKGLKDRDGFKKCLQYTLFRPRDLLVLLNNAFLHASREDRKEIIDDDIEATSKQISQNRLDDLIKEYTTVFPGIDLFVGIFKARKAFESFTNTMNYLAASCEVSPPGRKTLRSKLRGIYPARNKIS
jgi:hypothetical protein